jgi:hypothetical protein
MTMMSDIVEEEVPTMGGVPENSTEVVMFSKNILKRVSNT